jgi:hypothetical protein
LAGKRISLLLAATLAVASTSTSHASLSERDRPELSWVIQVGKGSKRLYRARFAVDFDTVKPVCVTLKKANVSCVAISPTVPTNTTPIVVTPASAPPGQPPSVSPKVRATPPPHRAKPPQPKSIWQAIKDSVKQ